MFQDEIIDSKFLKIPQNLNQRPITLIKTLNNQARTPQPPHITLLSLTNQPLLILEISKIAIFFLNNNNNFAHYFIMIIRTFLLYIFVLIGKILYIINLYIWRKDDELEQYLEFHW